MYLYCVVYCGDKMFEVIIVNGDVFVEWILCIFICSFVYDVYKKGVIGNLSGVRCWNWFFDFCNILVLCNSDCNGGRWYLVVK